MRFLRGLKRLFHRTRTEADLDHELRSYIDLAADEKIRQGMTPDGARRAALREFGGVEAVKEEVRDARAFAGLETVSQDVRYAIRGLRKSPGFAAIALLSLALGVGANSAIFSVFYAVVVRPLPYPDSGRLAAVGHGAPGQTGAWILTPEFVAWQNDQQVFTGLASWNDAQYNLTGAAFPERLVAAQVSPNFLEVLGIHPLAGRDFLPDDRQTAILTHEVWQRQFGGDAAAIGRSVLLSNASYTVVGVLPPGFRFPADYHAELLVPDILPNPPDFAARTFGGLHGIGRLRPGVTLSQAATQLAAIGRRYEPAMPVFFRKIRTETRVSVIPIQTELAGNIRPVLTALLGAVGLLLLLACVNVANLQLARATVRRREIGLRAALGASRTRLARLLVIENLVLAVIAGGLGLLAASGLLDILAATAGNAIPSLADFRIGWQLAVMAFTFSTIAGLLVGLVPAVVAPRLEVHEVLKGGALSLVGGNGARLRGVLVASQVALALVLLLGSGLLLRSLQNVLSVDLGYRPDHVLMAGIRLTGPQYKTDAQRAAFFRSLLDRVQALPGADAAAIVNSPPLAGGYSFGARVALARSASGSTWDGVAPRAAADSVSEGSAIVAVTPSYLQVLGIRLLRGRFLTDHDTAGAPSVAVVNESFVQQLLRNDDPIGKTLFWTGNQSTIVGVIADVRHSGPEANRGPEVLVCEWQHPQNVARIVIRTKNAPLSLGGSIRPIVWSLDKDLPVFDVYSMEDRLTRSGSSRRLQTVLLSCFGLLALLLSAVGIYGVASEAVAQRTREIGLRMALGARAMDIIQTILGRSLVLTCAGIAAGAGAGVFLVRFMKALLFGIQPTDLMAFAAACLLLFAVSLLSGYLPARRAARIDPMSALRCD